nr:hypothetical protein 2 [bacterium]
MTYFKLICIEAEIVVVAKDEEEAAFVGLEICNSQNFTLVDIEPVKMGKGDYYPNKWQAVKDIEEGLFDDLPFDEFFEWRVCSHELLPGWHSIIRVHDKKSGKVKEHVYKSRHHAINKVKSLMKNPNVRFDVATENGVVGYP